MTINMHDTANLQFQGGIPDNAEAVMFYVDGLFNNEAAARTRFPHLFAMRYTVGLSVRGRVAQGEDFEPGNWAGDMGRWVRDSLAAGVWRPVAYEDRTDENNTVIPELEREFGSPLPPPGPKRPFRLIVALPGATEIPPEADACQNWWGSIQGGGKVDMDITLCRDDFFQVPATPQLTQLPKDTTMIAVGKLADGRTELFVEDKNGEVWHTWQEKQPPEGKGGWVGAEDGKRNAQWYSLGVPGQ